jgi:chromosome segregation ATPase
MVEFGAAIGAIDTELKKIRQLEELRSAVIAAQSAEQARDEALKAVEQARAMADNVTKVADARVSAANQKLADIENKIVAALAKYTEDVSRQQADFAAAKEAMVAEIVAIQERLDAKTIEAADQQNKYNNMVSEAEAKLATLQSAYDSLKAMVK